MSAPQIHPEDLLDRARRGSLASDEQRLLQRHLSQCVACRFELSLSPGLYAHVALGAEDDAILDRALAKSSPVRKIARRGRRAKIARTAVLVAAAVGFAAIASAGVSAWRRQTVARLEAPAITRADRPASAKIEPESHRALPGREPAIEQPMPPTDPVPSLAAAEPRRTVDRGAGSSSCADRFRRANEARRSGATDEAVRLYSDLRTGCSGTSEELSARVLLGRIYLDRVSDPARALSAFESYLGATSHGALREDAMIGRALALGKLNRATDEANAWQALLSAYPDSLYAEKARARLNGRR